MAVIDIGLDFAPIGIVNEILFFPETIIAFRLQFIQDIVLTLIITYGVNIGTLTLSCWSTVEYWLT